MSANEIKGLDAQQIDELLCEGDLALAVKANLSVMRSANEQTEILERTVIERVKLKPQFRYLKTVPGIGPILALTIMLETGDIGRFASVGNFASYCRCVGSQKISNGKRKGSGNTRTGISIWVGHLLRQPTMQSGSIPESRVSTRERI